MFKSLRLRLLASNIALIGLTLAIVGLALVFILSRWQLPERETYTRLINVARAIRPYTEEAGRPPIDTSLAQFAQRSEVRILRVDNTGLVLFDSEGGLSGTQLAVLRPTDARLIPRDSPYTAGRFLEANNEQWLFIAMQPPRGTNWQILFALPRPRAAALTLFNTSLVPPLIQSGLIGLAFAVILAVLISSSVSKPLKQVANAAHALASGDYDQRAAEQGPLEVRDLARAFNHMARQVQRSQQTQRDFLANASHELKTPLTSIQGYSQAILDGTAPDTAHAAAIIHDEAERMQRLVQDLLNLSRIESGQITLQQDKIHIGNLLEPLVQRFKLLASEQSIALIYQEPSPPPMVVPVILGDGDRLAQVFINLIDNALVHTPEGGQVRIEWQLVQPGIEVCIHDTGQGIPEAERERIFERFYQVDKSRKRANSTGTGLGLTISKEIVEAHHGRIMVKEGTSIGSTFSVWLPLMVAEGTLTSRGKLAR